MYDGGLSTSPMMGKYCGDSIPPRHVSSSNEILIHFEADYYNMDNNGFEMTYNPTGKQNTPIQNNTEYHNDRYVILRLLFSSNLYLFYIKSIEIGIHILSI